MKLMKLEIVTPLGVIFDDEIKQVTLPGSEGEFGVLPEHASLVSLLDTGVIVIDTKDGKELSVAVDAGYVKVEENKTLCVADGAVALNGKGSDLEKAINEAKDLLQKAQNSSTAIASAMGKVEHISKSL
ncbi:MAG TPA: F0F1 ATP synthase subunit epsilon [Campylobacterales bacterium]|jgi:F-type H+-transporting ATPase subunit epsilon|nr:F0F1 ATP synthase subunit epsilon [Campylobacterales bacterium]HHD80675.1 F0F1 ATP synthase subunit epsilon [Campylobacterales bacterium]HHH51186.1 F0F1 ATP synthase subunit epsilon [Campylobacterales bacterium]